MKRIVTILIMMCMMFTMTEGVFAKAKKVKKPGKPKLSINIEKTRLSWKKVKNAKKYEVWRTQTGHWVKIKTITSKKSKYTFVDKVVEDKDNQGWRYYQRWRYKVYAVNGKKRTASNVVKFYAEPPARGNGEIWYKLPKEDENYKYVEYKDGDTIPFTCSIDLIRNAKVLGSSYWGRSERLTYIFLEKEGVEGRIELPSKFSNGGDIKDGVKKAIVRFGEYAYDWMDIVDPTDGIEDDGYDYEYTIMESLKGCYGVGSWRENVVLYWTLDGTEPVPGQEDLYGDTTGHFKESVAETVQMRGTVRYGDGYKVLGIRGNLYSHDDYTNEGSTECVWVKAYKDGKFIGECLDFKNLQ